MFDYPLTIPRKTLYASLGLRPEARDDEIRAALARAVRRCRTEKAAIDRRIEAVFSKLPDLREAYRQRDQLLGGGPGCDAELRALHRRIADLEAAAEGIEPAFRSLRTSSEALAQEENGLNRMELNSPEMRDEYDRRNPPLGLLKLEDCSSDAFLAERPALLRLLRREISQALEARGEVVLHPTDESRSDFTDDYTFTPLLDGEADEE